MPTCLFIELQRACSTKTHFSCTEPMQTASQKCLHRTLSAKKYQEPARNRESYLVEVNISLYHYACRFYHDLSSKIDFASELELRKIKTGRETLHFLVYQHSLISSTEISKQISITFGPMLLKPKLKR